MKNNKSNLFMIIISIIMFIIGFLIFFYPTISNYIANKNFERVINNYENKNSEVKKEDLTKEYEKAEKYNNSLVGDPVYDPFVPGTGYVLPGNYEEVLNLGGDGIMGYIEIPKISLKIPIYHGSSEKTLEKGIGHIETSALPIGGLGNNPILTGHRGLPQAELFTRLDELNIKDKIFLNVLDLNLAYEVDKISVILPNELSKLASYKDKDLVTLITCTPYGVNTHRLVVQGHRIPYVKEEKDKIKKSRNFKLSESFLIRIFGIILGIGILIVILFLIKRSKGNEKKNKDN